MMMFINKKVNLIMDESDVLIALKIIDKYSNSIICKNCGWADDANKWFIMGDIKRWDFNGMISELKKEFELEEKELKRIYLTKIKD